MHDKSAVIAPRVHACDWSSAYADHAGAIARYLFRLTSDREIASDLLQDVFVNAMRAERAPLDDAQLRPWLFRIATNLAVDHLRARHRRRLLPFRLPQSAPAPESAEQRDHIARALGALPPEQAAVLVLRVHQGYRCEEIAALLNVSARAVEGRLARARLNFAAAYQRVERGLAQ